MLEDCRFRRANSHVSVGRPDYSSAPPIAAPLQRVADLCTLMNPGLHDANPARTQPEAVLHK